MKEIVKYNNQLNSVHFSGFSAKEMDLLMMICAKVKEKGIGEITLEYSQLKNLSGMSAYKNNQFSKELLKMAKKLQSLQFCGIEKNDFVLFVLFPTFICENNKLTVSVNPKFSFLLNELTQNFTRFELSEFVTLKSKYAKHLYRLLKQYRRSGTYQVKADDFRELMCCPKSYPNMIFMRDCIKPAINELSHGYFENLKVEPIKANKQGAPIIAYKFTFKPSDQLPGQMNLNDYEKSKEYKNAFNDFPQRKYDFDELEKQLLK